MATKRVSLDDMAEGKAPRRSDKAQAQAQDSPSAKPAGSKPMSKDTMRVIAMLALALVLGVAVAWQYGLFSSDAENDGGEVVSSFGGGDSSTTGPRTNRPRTPDSNTSTEPTIDGRQPTEQDLIDNPELPPPSNRAIGPVDPSKPK